MRDAAAREGVERPAAARDAVAPSATDHDALAVEFEGHRRRLVSVAYRMLGTLAEAEDAVQDAWLRLSAADDVPRDMGAWLTTVVGRLCLDRLRSARTRRETYVGPWLPEPVVTTPGPAEQVETDESVRFALLVVLERLTPEQRVALVLHDALGVPFADVAAVLGTTTATARQHASRARRVVEGAHQAPSVPLARQEEVVAAFLAAAAGGDLAALVRVLAPAVVLTSDGGGKVRAALRPVVGADAVARLLLGLVAQGIAGRGGATAGPPGGVPTPDPSSDAPRTTAPHADASSSREMSAASAVTVAGPRGRITVDQVLVNGAPGLVVRMDGTDGSTDVSVVVPHVDAVGRIAAVDMVRNPDKLTRLPRYASGA